MGAKRNNGHRGRWTVDWNKEPVGVFLGTSPTALKVFPEEAQALEFVNSLSLVQKEKAFIGRLNRVMVKTTVSIEK